MIRYAKVVNQETKECNIGTGINTAYYKKLGMVEMEVEQAYNGAWYVKGYAPVAPEPTLEEQVARLEAETGLTRVMREMVLAEGSGASEYVKGKAEEIEALAEQLRTVKESLQVEEVVISETENTTTVGEGWNG